jgi:hypothetical protein
MPFGLSSADSLDLTAHGILALLSCGGNASEWPVMSDSTSTFADSDRNVHGVTVKGSDVDGNFSQPGSSTGSTCSTPGGRTLAPRWTKYATCCGTPSRSTTTSGWSWHKTGPDRSVAQALARSRCRTMRSRGRRSTSSRRRSPRCPASACPARSGVGPRRSGRGPAVEPARCLACLAVIDSSKVRREWPEKAAMSSTRSTRKTHRLPGLAGLDLVRRAVGSYGITWCIPGRMDAGRGGRRRSSPRSAAE